MKYVILAAGKGTRLHPVTHHIPKPLISLVTGKSILEYEICNVAKTGMFDEILIITGYKQEMIQHVAASINCPIKITCIANKNWDNPSPLFSLDAVSRTIKLHDVVITNGDTIHTPPFFTIFRINHPVEDIRLFVSVANQYQEDDMRVSFSPHLEKLTKISKSLSYDDTHAVSTGMLLLKGTAKRELFLQHLSTLLSQKPVKPFWHAIVDQMIKERLQVNYSFTPYNSWFEIDRIEDLARANKHI